MNNPRTQDINLYTFNVQDVEIMLANQDWNGCWEYLGAILEKLTMTANHAAHAFSLRLENDMRDETKRKYINEFGQLLGELLIGLLSSPSVTLADKSFEHLFLYHETMHTLFSICNMGSTDPLVINILGDEKKKLSAGEQKRALLLMGLDTNLDFDKILPRLDSKYRLSAIVAYMSYRKINKEQLYNNKVKLLGYRKEIERIEPGSKLFEQLIHCYFLCSFLNVPGKHAIKENINITFQAFHRQNSKNYKRMREAAVGKYDFELDPNKKTVMIVTEGFAKAHSMYRCWGPRAVSIQSEFNVVFCIPVVDADEALREDFKNYVPIQHFGELIEIASVIKPEIIFMPSIGMEIYNPLLTNLRLAPIQIVGLGNPATPMSDFVDYVVGPKSIYDERAFPKDIYIADGYPGTYVPLISREKFLAPIEKTVDRKGIRVCVVGSDIKVSYPFFKLLKEIVAESPFPIHVSFMMGVGGIDSFYIEKFLKENFENCTYYGWQPYLDYIEAIKGIDIFLNPFPFGHTNTIVDTLMCGKPCVGLDGIEPASKSEGDVLQTVGLKDKFIAKDEADYKAKFFALSEQILNGQTEFFDRNEIYDRLFTEQKDYDYGKVMQWIVEHHVSMKASGKKYFEVFQNM